MQDQPGLKSQISKGVAVKYKPGDLVEVSKHRSETYAGVVVSGRPTSLYVEARPYKIIDEVMYKIVSSGNHTFAYEYQMRKLND